MTLELSGFTKEQVTTGAAMTRHFVSFPKSGRTWIRFILVQLELETLIKFHHDNFEFNDGSCPPHNFNISNRLDKYSSLDKLVYLQRDPRDIMVSLYYQVTGRFKDFYEYQGSISEFIIDDYFGAHNLQRFREMWNEICRLKQYLVISYEECHEDMFRVIRMLIDYYDFCVDSQHIVLAVENAKFIRMKQLEQSENFPHPWLRPRNGSPKVRVGKVGGYREQLSEADVTYLNDVFKLN